MTEYPEQFPLSGLLGDTDGTGCVKGFAERSECFVTQKSVLCGLPRMTVGCEPCV